MIILTRQLSNISQNIFGLKNGRSVGSREYTAGYHYGT